MTNCKTCGQTLPEQHANKVSISGMFDCHLFCSFSYGTVDDVIAAWIRKYKEPNMVKFSKDGKANDIGPPALCPAIVSYNEIELRRVGPMVHDANDTETIQKYRKALLADPDIPRLLQEKE
jgi:hypothetical protein